MDFFFWVTTTWNLPERAAAASIHPAMSRIRSPHVFSVAPVRHESEHNSDQEKTAKSFRQLNTEIIAIFDYSSVA